VAIADTAGNNWFNPAQEFSAMDQERVQAESSLRENPKS